MPHPSQPAIRSERHPFGRVETVGSPEQDLVDDADDVVVVKGAVVAHVDALVVDRQDRATGRQYVQSALRGAPARGHRD